ncbi:MAG: hypothetical protein ACERKN_06825 [Velocimicrobium sp.]
MVANYKTPFGLLMELTGVRACDLSKKLHVDRSLIGKWKNGVRQIPARSYYWEGIVACLTETEFQQKQIDNFFENFIGDEYSSKMREKHIINYILYENLDQLTHSKQNESNFDYLYKTTAYIYKSLEGRKKAFRNLLEYALLFQGKVLSLYDCTNFSWLFDDTNYFDQIHPLLASFFKNKNSIRLIIAMNAESETTTKLVNYLYLYAFRQEITCYYFMPFDIASSLSIYVFEEDIALFGNSCDTDWNKTYTQICTDSLTILQYQAIFNQLLQTSHSFKSAVFPNLIDFKDYVTLFSSISETIYAFIPTISFFSMEESLLNKVLTYNKITAEQTAQIHYWRTIFTEEMNHLLNQTNVKIYFIHDLNALHLMRQKDYVMYSDNFFSYIPTIQVHQSDFNLHLDAVVNRIKNTDNLEIGILENDYPASSIIQNIGFRICKNKCWFMGTIHDGITFTKDKYMVQFQYMAAKALWESIPHHLKDKADVIKILLE